MCSIINLVTLKWILPPFATQPATKERINSEKKNWNLPTCWVVIILMLSHHEWGSYTEIRHIQWLKPSEKFSPWIGWWDRILWEARRIWISERGLHCSRSEQTRQTTTCPHAVRGTNMQNNCIKSFMILFCLFKWQFYFKQITVLNCVRVCICVCVCVWYLEHPYDRRRVTQAHHVGGTTVHPVWER